VSYALNGDPDSRLTAATKQKVLDAAKRLGYEPSAAARLLRGGRSRTVLVLSPARDGYTSQMSTLIDQLAKELAQHGYSLIWQLGVAGAPRPVAELSPAVVLTAATREDPEFAGIFGGFPVPVIPILPGRDSFIALAGQEQVRYMAGHGLTNLVYAAPESADLANMSELRWSAVQTETSRLGLPKPEHVVWPSSRSGSRAALERVVSLKAGSFGICAYNDDVALSVLAGAFDAGVVVPDGVSVIGVDDIPAAAVANPALSTIGSDLSGYVQQMARYVARVAAGESASPPELPRHMSVVERDSVSTSRRTHD
jgi:DNA-binding LacI/PurR family transcriptional regulator